MRSLAQIMPEGQARSAVAREKLVQAYREVFMAGSEWADLVLTDLVDNCLWFRTLAINASEAELRDHNARRAVFEHILRYLNPTPGEMAEIEQAARREQIANETEGIL